MLWLKIALPIVTLAIVIGKHFYDKNVRNRVRDEFKNNYSEDFSKDIRS